MSIFSRFSDIINSNLNALLDKAEDPQKMVRLIIQEMEDTLVEVRSVAARTLAEKKELARQLGRLETEITEWESRAELALSKNREDLARAALVEKTKVQESYARLTDEAGRVDEHVVRLGDEISQLQEKLNDAKARQLSIVSRERAATTHLTVKKTLDSPKIEQALQKFDRYEAKIDNLESQAEAYDLGKRTLADEFKQLENEAKITSELDALKARLQQNTSNNEHND